MLAARSSGCSRSQILWSAAACCRFPTESQALTNLQRPAVLEIQRNVRRDVLAVLRLSQVVVEKVLNDGVVEPVRNVIEVQSENIDVADAGLRPFEVALGDWCGRSSDVTDLARDLRGETHLAAGLSLIQSAGVARLDLRADLDFERRAFQIDQFRIAESYLLPGTFFHQRKRRVERAGHD